MQRVFSVLWSLAIGGVVVLWLSMFFFPKRCTEPAIFRTVEPFLDVDAVYTWVDGNDSAWQRQYRQVQSEQDRPAVIEAARFRDNDELKYSLRSIYQYAPWFRTVYIVTANQSPVWLNLDSVVVIDHREIIPPQFLPTFSSRAIELYLHRIPRLSETFVYFNDDVALLKTYEPGDLVSPAGRLLYSQERVLMPSGPRAENESVWEGSLKHMNRVLDKRYGKSKEKRLLVAHQPYVFRKSMFQGLIEDFPEEIEATALEPFRQPTGISTPTFFAYCGYYTNRVEFVPDRTVVIHKDLPKIKGSEFRKRYQDKKFLCMQDYEDIDRRDWKKFYRTLFPYKSPFEN